MRILLSVSFLLVFGSMSVFAVEPVDEQQIMLYYQVPLGAVKAQEGRHQFGLRMDQVSHAPGEDVPIHTLADRPAAMDFRMDYDGIRSLKIRGVDYAPYLVARAAAAESESAPVAAEPVVEGNGSAAADTQAAEAAPAEGAGAETAAAPEEEKKSIWERMDALPFGVIIGVMIGIGYLSGQM